LIATLNDQGATIRKLESERLQHLRDLHAARADLAECQRTQSAMRQAVYGAAKVRGTDLTMLDRIGLGSRGRLTAPSLRR
jgi:hypothetical protein